MNTYQLSLSNFNYSGTTVYSTVELFDKTELSMSFLNIKKDILPTYMSINWGDGSEVFVPDLKLIREYRKDSILNEILYGAAPPFIVDPYKHVYTPSSTALIKSLTASSIIEYATGDIYNFIIPINIRSEGFYETIGDLKLIDVTINNNEENSSTFVFASDKSGHILELNNND